MASITTQIPTGPIRNAYWCYQSLYDIFSDDHFKPDFNTCANSTLGTVDSDFQSFCCDGDIIGLYDEWPNARDHFNFEELSCCRIQKPQQGGLGPIPDNNGRTCTATAKPTPLASLAATNTANAQSYLITYLDASAIGTTWTDWTTRATPTCFWIDTAHGVAMTKVTVRAAAITTLPPDTANVWYYTDAYSTQGNSGLDSNVVESSVDVKSTAEFATISAATSATTSAATSAVEAGSSSPVVAATTTTRPTSASTALNLSTAICLGLLLSSCLFSVR